MTSNDEFLKWLLKHRKLKESTAKVYYRVINIISTDLKNEGFIKDHLYLIEDSQQAERISKEYFAMDVYKKKNMAGNQTNSAAFNKYIEYLKSIEQNQTKSPIENTTDSWTIKNDGSIAYKWVDKSIFDYGTHVPKRLVDRFFLTENALQIGERRGVKLRINGVDYDANFSCYKRNDSDGFNYHIRYDSNKELKNLLATEFKYSFNEQSAGDYKEYIAFYKTENPDIYEIKLIKKEEFETLELMSIEPLEFIDYLDEYMKSRGLIYSIELLKTIYISMRSKPFILLAGLSGSGKSRFVRGLAEACGAFEDNGQYLMVPVRPDWSDASDVLGYTNLKGDFVATELTRFIARANQSENSDKPYFVCIDEMNLARVEHYFSDVLSVIETRRMIDGHIESSRLFSGGSCGEFSDIKLSDNIYIFGTVNMDETTHPFSNKVLDRANTIEFNHIDLSNIPDAFNDEFEQIAVSNTVLRSDFDKVIQAIDCISPEDKNQVISELERINSTLSEIGLGYGYRVRDEVLYFIAYSLRDKLLTLDDALDFCIFQKVLPKIKGSQQAVKMVLISLFEMCMVSKGNWNDDKKSDCEFMKTKLKQPTTFKYYQSAQKIMQLMKSFEVEGYASYWN